MIVDLLHVAVELCLSFILGDIQHLLHCSSHESSLVLNTSDVAFKPAGSITDEPLCLYSVQNNVTSIYNCEPIQLPTYDFRESTRYFTGEKLERKPGELVILEGIHSLDPDVVGLPDEDTAKIYISVRTRITQNGRELHPAKIRLMRRLVRDYLFRKRSFADTLMMYDSVEEGENKYIMPYKYRSTYDVDTFMAYEICAYQPFLLEALRSMPLDERVEDMLDFLSEAAPLEAKNITPDSLVCEFIGNSAFA